MKIIPRFTRPGQDVFSTVEWSLRTSRITNSDGSTVFEMNDAEVPASWSQLATDIVVSKYFRKAGVPQIGADGQPRLDAAGRPQLGPERSVRQVVHRLAGCWRHWGETHGYFATPQDAQHFYNEIAWMMLNQVAAPNSPQWFNTGLNWAYGISGPAQGHWIADHATGAVSLAEDAYSHPQPHACFIQSVRDDLVGDGGIMDLWTREARLFKYGSGTGTNFSRLRGENEPLSGGGKSSGLMSFLKIGDRAAGAIKSGGTTRRAAKMVCLDVDHPDIEAFVNWKVREELKVAALVEGAKRFTPEQKEVASRLKLKLDLDFNGESYQTVSGQNSNNSIRLSDEFMNAVDADAMWNLTQRTDGKVAKSLPARDLWQQISFAAWQCADPGLQYDGTINAWHTCPAGGRINASNPCSEYMFLDNTACNLASINLLKFYDPQTRTFDLEGYEHAITLWTMVLEISVLMAAFPSREIAELSWKYRTLGLGYANLGAMLMQAGIPYDSDEGRAVCGALSAILTGRSYAASALLAAEHGAFAGYAQNRESMLRVIRNHRRAAYGVDRASAEWESLPIRPVPIDHRLFKERRIPLLNASDLLSRSLACWDDALLFGSKFGFRNAQVTVIAPTGTIGLLMDCDTTGVEPDFALTKFKKLAGGGYFKIANQSLRPAFKALGYSDETSDRIMTHVIGTLSLDTPLPARDGQIVEGPATFRDFLANKGYTSDDLVALENQLPTVFELGFAFTAWSMPEAVLARAGLTAAAAKADPRFNGLRVLGLNRRQIETLNRLICGSQTVEGTPLLKPEHLPVFDCANKCGATGTRFIRPDGHILMMAAAQPFISGAISKTINLPSEATVEEVGASYRLSWELGLKANALYRDGSKLSQPLNTKVDVEAEEEDFEGLDDAEATSSTSVTTTVIHETHASGAQTVDRRVEISEAGPMSVAAAKGGDEFIERVVERVVERVIERPLRRRLPETRGSITHKFNVAGHEGYLIVGLYEDGRPGELFITMAKEGSTIGGLMDSLGTAISVALQYGVPVESLVTKFAHQRFEPMGMTTNSEIPFAKSLVDYIFRWMGMQFINGYRELNSPRRGAAAASHGTPDVPASVLHHMVKEDTGWSSRTEGAAHRTPDRFLGLDGSVASSAAPIDRAPSTVEFIDPAKTDATPSRLSVAELGRLTGESLAGAATTVTIHEETVTSGSFQAAASVLDQSNAQLMGDAPACDVCGAITVRNGTCYRCLNCGNSMGCS
jgi:ribonucleoside-diphosphate reductase alpha chain